jgi:glycosyltransferase involved in cell wall biosynthesis
MRILIATWHRNLVGGTEKYVHSLLPALVNRGHEVSLIHEVPVDHTLETIDLSDSALVTWCLEELGLEALMRAVAQWKPDIVYSQGLGDAELDDALLDNYPTALFAHAYYGTCATGSKSHAFPQLRPCKRRFGPACLLLHYPRRCGGLSPLTMWRTYRRQVKQGSRLPDYPAVLVASTHMYHEFLRHGVRSEQLHLVPHAANQDPHAEPPEPRIPQGRILLIARLTAIKGGHYLVQAISKASMRLGRALTLTIAGDGPERHSIEGLASRLHVGVEFTGWVNTREIMGLLRATDVLAVPSLWPEPFGLVGLEAACIGVPAIGYAVGGIPDWLIPGETGELAPGDPPTVEGMADAIVRAFGDTKHYADLCRGAWQHSKRLTMDAHLSKLELCLDSVASNPQQCVVTAAEHQVNP